MSYFNQGHPIVFEVKRKTKCFKVTVKARQRCINISISLWQRVSVLLDKLCASIQRFDVPPSNVNHSTLPICSNY
jgi:hypothetical protein